MPRPRIPKWQQEAMRAFRQKVPTAADDLTPSMYTFAFTSAGVQEVDLLSDLSDLIQQAIDSGESYSAQGYDSFIDKALDLVDQHTGGDSPLTPSRLKLIYQTNVRQAYGLAQWRRGVDKWHLQHYPAWRFVRTPGAKVKRFAHTYTENWVRLKLDYHFWANQMNARSLGGFEVPYAPFGFNSYMVLEHVSRAEAIAAGIPAAAIDAQAKENPALGKFSYLLPQDWEFSHTRISTGEGKKRLGYKARRRKLQRKLYRMKKKWEKEGNPAADFTIERGKVVIRYRDTKQRVTSRNSRTSRTKKN